MSSIRASRTGCAPVATATVPVLEGLESRRLLAGNVTATLAGGVLTITGDDAANAVVVSQQTRRVANQAAADGGVTSVDLDTDLLAAAANLKLTAANSTGRPAPGFDVGFPILKSSTFVFQKTPFAPVGGTIEHSGTVTFDAKGTPVTVGKFQIGFDPARATGGRSGFFVRDTAGGLGILFDVSAPDAVSVRHDRLAITGADLLVSPEFAAALQSLGLASANLTGADVGDAQVNATTDPVVARSLEVRGLATKVNGASAPARFDAGAVASIDANLAGGHDALTLLGVHLPGDLTARLGAGRDLLAIVATRVNGDAVLDGGADKDRVAGLFSRFGTLSVTSFESGSARWASSDDDDDDDRDDD